MLQNMFNGCFSFGPQGGMLEDRTSGFGISFEHPYSLILVDSDIKSDFSNQMLMICLDSFCKCDSYGFCIF
ncbi:hypothetical protein D3C76_1631280 [compost metagenome]